MAEETFDALGVQLIAVRTPIGEATILASDEERCRSTAVADSTRLLPSGDTYYLLQGTDRELLLPDETHRNQLWTSRVWPGAVLHGGDIVATWRRSQHKVTIEAWTPLIRADREAMEAEATRLPIPGVSEAITVKWD